MSATRMSPEVRPPATRDGANPEPGQAWDYIVRRHGARAFAHRPLKITRPGKRPGDWMAYRLLPEDWEAPGQEWRITREQLEDGRYARRPDVEAKLAAKQGVRP